MTKTKKAVARLHREVDLLRREVHELRDGGRREVRTGRVSVVDEEGVVRVVLAARHRAGVVQARLAGEEGRSTGIELFAVEAVDGLEPQIGLEVIREGDAGERWPSGAR